MGAVGGDREHNMCLTYMGTCSGKCEHFHYCVYVLIKRENVWKVHVELSCIAKAYVILEVDQKRQGNYVILNTCRSKFRPLLGLEI